PRECPPHVTSTWFTKLPPNAKLWSKDISLAYTGPDTTSSSFIDHSEKLDLPQELIDAAKSFTLFFSPNDEASVTKSSIINRTVVPISFSPVGSNIWFKLYGPPYDRDVDLMSLLFSRGMSWDVWVHIIRLIYSGLSYCSWQIHQWNTILSMMRIMALISFHDIGDVEFQDNWVRVWVDIGTSDYFALDVLLTVLSS
nr:hypothetical protein [Tanacetum cinerariifolium]